MVARIWLLVPKHSPHNVIGTWPFLERSLIWIKYIYHEYINIHEYIKHVFFSKAIQANNPGMWQVQKYKVKTVFIWINKYLESTIKPQLNMCTLRIPLHSPSDLFLMLEVQRFLKVKRAHFKLLFQIVVCLLLQRSHLNPMRRSSSRTWRPALFSPFPALSESTSYKASESLSNLASFQPMCF